jgi:glutaconate CoA-transferase subunit B
MSSPACRPEEFLAAALAREIGNARHVAVGAASPIPAAAAFLTEMRSGGRLRVTVLHSRRHNRFTDGGRELFDCAAQGRIDVFFLGGVQIDGQANINLVGLGAYPELTQRFAGSFGSAFMYFVVPRVILFREEHSRRTLVEKVDFISAPGASADNVYRPGGPRVLVTGRAVFAFDRRRRRFRLQSAHPGHAAAEIRAQTGFDYDSPEVVATTPGPDAADLSLLRGPIAERLAEFYPAFAGRVFPYRTAIAQDAHA